MGESRSLTISTLEFLISSNVVVEMLGEFYSRNSCSSFIAYKFYVAKYFTYTYFYFISGVKSLKSFLIPQFMLILSFSNKLQTSYLGIIDITAGFGKKFMNSLIAANEQSFDPPKTNGRFPLLKELLTLSESLSNNSSSVLFSSFPCI